MNEIHDELLAFTASPLYDYRMKNGYFPVVGEGSHTAKVVFIGEAPGENEAKKARPFCGASGRILDELLASIEVDRKDVYITNIVKDRPPANRDPTTEEIELYAPFLDRQLAIIKPAVIATLGRFSMAYIINRLGLGNKLTSISEMHGKSFTATPEWGSVHIIPLYHPAVALYKASMKASLLEDFKMIKEIIES
jgi:DNA polymerase